MEKKVRKKKKKSLHIRLLKFFLGFVRFCFIILILLFFIGAGGLYGLLKGYQDALPKVTDKSFRPNLTTEIYDVNGLILARLHAEENRDQIVSIADIPKVVQNAVISIEDERFFSHFGIDIKGIFRAAASIFKHGRVTQGGSTLTQQLVKNAFLTPERTLKRKIKEALLSIQLERKYSKLEILQFYLNEIYFGHGSYGVNSASQVYFGKPVTEVNLTEAATLAALIANPTLYSPRKFLEKSRKRKNLVLRKMYELGHISQREYEEAKNQDPVLAVKKEEGFLAPYFVTHVREQLLERYGSRKVYEGGLKIYTSLDYNMQIAAEQAFASSSLFLEFKGDLDKEKLNGALIALEPRTGAIKAMVGGRKFEESQFNRATQARRQPGSGFKPIIYASAIENNYSPVQIMLDEPIEYKDPMKPGEYWKPLNYDLKFHGSVVLRRALELSYNIVAIRLLEAVGVEKVVNLAARMGISTPLMPYLSLALGASEVVPLDMAIAYGVLANHGIRSDPLSILKVVDRDGMVLEENRPRHRKVLSDEVAYIVTDMLKGVVRNGTGRRADVGRPQAGKTGTTNEYNDAWFFGYTPDLVCVVQFGFDDPKTLGNKQAGGTVAAPVWKAFMEKALVSYPPNDWIMPSTLKKGEVCMTSGLLFSPLCPRLDKRDQSFTPEKLPTMMCKAHNEPGFDSNPWNNSFSQNEVSSLEIEGSPTQVHNPFQEPAHNLTPAGLNPFSPSQTQSPSQRQAPFRGQGQNPFATQDTFLPVFENRLLSPTIQWKESSGEKNP